MKNRLKAGVIKANANYYMVIEKCWEMIGGEKAASMKDAKTAKIDDMMKAKSDNTLAL